jgi:hypothetical protein
VVNTGKVILSNSINLLGLPFINLSIPPMLNQYLNNYKYPIVVDKYDKTSTFTFDYSLTSDPVIGTTTLDFFILGQMNS